MFNNAQIRKYAGVEVCTALTKADHWSGGDVKAPHLNDAPEPWIGLFCLPQCNAAFNRFLC